MFPHAPASTVPEEQLEEEEVKLDAEAESLLEELAASQAEVQRMLQLQKEQAMELGGLKEQLAAEVCACQQQPHFSKAQLCARQQLPHFSKAQLPSICIVST